MARRHHPEQLVGLSIAIDRFLWLFWICRTVINPYNVVPVFSCLLFFAALRPAREFVFPPAVLVGEDIRQDGAKDWC